MHRLRPMFVVVVLALLAVPAARADGLTLSGLSGQAKRQCSSQRRCAVSVHVRYTLSIGARVTFTLVRAGSRVPLGTFNSSGAAGANVARVPHTIDGAKVRPGRYTLMAQAVSGSMISAPIRAVVRIPKL